MFEEIKEKAEKIKVILPTRKEKKIYRVFAFGISNMALLFWNTQTKKHKAHYKIQEALWNAARHGNKENPKKEIKATLWFTKEELLVMIQDEGSFFSSEETKEKIESRSHLKPTHEKSYGVGMSFIYKSDKIKVDTRKGVLYILIKKPQ